LGIFLKKFFEKNFARAEKFHLTTAQMIFVFERAAGLWEPAGVNEPLPLPPHRPFWHSKTLRFMLLLAVAGLALWARRWHADGAAAGQSPESSALFRFGGGFCGGFFIGWAYRKSLRLAALIFGGLVALIGMAKWSGLIHLDWDAVTKSLNDVFAMCQGELARCEKFLMGLLPSGFAGLLGVFKGARQK
jgi:uncharacterized membrane protein (Fun14 family)